MNDFSLKIKSNITNLSKDHLMLFGNLNCKKMFPSYKFFSEIENWGNVTFFSDLIDFVFNQIIDNSYSLPYKTLDEGLTENIPDLDNFQSIIASYAFDAACAFSELIQYIKTNDVNHLIENAQSCINTVDMFIQQKENIRYVNNISELEKLIAQDGYMQKETNRQLTLLKELRRTPLIDEKAVKTMNELNESFGELIDYKIILR